MVSFYYLLYNPMEKRSRRIKLQSIALFTKMCRVRQAIAIASITCF
ncbi:MAG: hypothetical protein F6K21_22845 [Symploca sp. SIO2D2]|nr:hypothetical protein [Symploca sp. SIO2D2]